jgi:hypothetical protein
MGNKYALFIIVAGFLIGSTDALIPCFSFIGIILASNILNKLNYKKRS